ncbi:MAG: hypothetical protein ETSY2_28495 [Candidatus Entotheonella gemina]|uniref:Uncharacterized protein n=1 Tax=Candidatus Entotheonella gemina TaxID=1429439 RepID=W4M2S5_9BACT|nr:MAG: hypothetical protein ETSY2_28495 [Candidatus Entotheonella gemina]
MISDWAAEGSRLPQDQTPLGIDENRSITGKTVAAVGSQRAVATEIRGLLKGERAKDMPTATFPTVIHCDPEFGDFCLLLPL